MGRIYDIMCDHITYEDLHFARVTEMDDITYDDPQYDDLSTECVRYGTD